MIAQKFVTYFASSQVAAHEFVNKKLNEQNGTISQLNTGPTTQCRV